MKGKIALSVLVAALAAALAGCATTGGTVTTMSTNAPSAAPAAVSYPQDGGGLRVSGVEDRGAVTSR